MSSHSRSTSISTQSHSRDGVIVKKRYTPTCCSNMKRATSASFLYFNAQSIRNKLTDLKILLETNMYDIVFISETWLTDNDLDSSVLDTTNYCILRNDRLSHAGGVAAIFKSKYSDKVTVHDIESSYLCGFELLSFDIYLSPCSKVCFVCLYLPPHSAKDLGTVNNLIKVLRRVEKSQELYIVGDFNFSEYKFDNFVTSAYSEPLKRFMLFLEENNLSQLVTLPTHISGHTLDLIISSKPENITNIDILHPFTDTCDHNIIETTLSIKTSHKSYIDPKPNFYKADYDQINHYLSLTDWDSVLNTRNTNINEIYNSFLEVVHESIKLYVPIMKIKHNSKLPR